MSIENKYFTVNSKAYGIISAALQNVSKLNRSNSKTEKNEILLKKKHLAPVIVKNGKKKKAQGESLTFAVTASEISIFGVNVLPVNSDDRV